MNAPTSALLTPDAAQFAAAVRNVNAWRGRCVACFAAVEAQVTESIVAFAATDASVQLPHLVGQRSSALSIALARRGTIAADAASALTAWQTHDPLRAFLGHGVAKVTIARDGSWQAVFSLAALRSRKLHRSLLVVDEAEADHIVRALHRDRQRLEARLKPLMRGASAPEVSSLRIVNLQ